VYGARDNNSNVYADSKTTDNVTNASLHRLNEDMDDQMSGIGPQFKSPTLSALTDDQRSTWKWFGQNDDEASAPCEIAQQQQGNHNSHTVNQALTQALDQYTTQNISVQQPPCPVNVEESLGPNNINLDISDQAKEKDYGKTERDNLMLAGLELNQALEHAMNQATATHGNTPAQARSQSQVVQKPMKADGNHSILKRPGKHSSATRTSGLKLSLTKMKSSLLPSFGKKASSKPTSSGKSVSIAQADKQRASAYVKNKKQQQQKEDGARMKSYNHLRIGEHSVFSVTKKEKPNKTSKSSKVYSPKPVLEEA